MKTEILKFPLHAELHIRLPKGARITGVTVKDDITFLTVESGEGTPSLADLTAAANCDLQAMSKGTFIDSKGSMVPMEEHTLYTFLEGEKKGEDIILIPEEDANLRKLGVVNIVDPESTFHVFEKVQPGKFDTTSHPHLEEPLKASAEELRESVQAHFQQPK